MPNLRRTVSFDLEVMAKKTSRTQPDQHEVNCLAAFIEAVEELEHEPFCGEDDKSVYSMRGSQVTARFGDRFHFRSALVTFRRIWLKEEASNFNFICNLVERYEPSSILTTTGRDQFRMHTNMRWGRIPLTSGEVVDLWLNAVFAHTNLRRTKKPQWRDRVDFDKLVETHGHAMLEFICRTTVRAVITAAFNVVREARWALDRWEKDYQLRPEFVIGAPFGRNQRETTKAGHTVIRTASTEHLGHETELQRFERILARDRFRSLKSILDCVGEDREKLAAAVRRSNSYEQTLTELGYVFDLRAELDLRKNPVRVGPEHGVRAALPWLQIETGVIHVTLVAFEPCVITTHTAVEFFNAKFAELKAQFESR